jgi:integrase
MMLTVLRILKHTDIVTSVHGLPSSERRHKVTDAPEHLGLGIAEQRLVGVASELVDLRWEQIDLENAILHVRRVKQGTPATHPLTGRELRALRRLQREQEPKSPFVFVSERGDPFSNRGFQATVERAGKAAGFGMKIHPHMLRHACGYKLANDGVDTRTIQARFPSRLFYTFGRP